MSRYDPFTLVICEHKGINIYAYLSINQGHHVAHTMKKNPNNTCNIIMIATQDDI